jgi:hypothetical protein
MHRPKKKIHLRAKLATMHELVSLSWPQQAKMPAGKTQSASAYGASSKDIRNSAPWAMGC